jgi:hypothetical protein
VVGCRPKIFWQQPAATRSNVETIKAFDFTRLFSHNLSKSMLLFAGEAGSVRQLGQSGVIGGPGVLSSEGKWTLP